MTVDEVLAVISKEAAADGLDYSDNPPDTDTPDDEAEDPMEVWEDLHEANDLHERSLELFRRILKMNKAGGGKFLPKPFREDIVEHIGDVDVFTAQFTWENWDDD